MNKFAQCNCAKCPFHHPDNTFVRPVGPATPLMLIVGEGPGQTEAAKGAFFQGKSGAILRGVLANCRVDALYDVYYDNVTLCWPRLFHGKDKDAAMPQAMECCKQHLLATLEKFSADVSVVALGRFAQQLLGLTTLERWETEPYTGKRVIGIPHPAALLYEDGATGMFVFEKAIEKAVIGPKPEIGEPQANWKIDVDPWDMELPDLNSLADQRLCVDVETTGKNWRDPRNHVFMFGLAAEKNKSVLILTRDALARPAVQAWQRALFAAHGANIGGHNFKFDINFLHREFDVLPIVGWDTISMVNCYHEYWHKDLKTLATYICNAPAYARPIHAWIKDNVKASKGGFKIEGVWVEAETDDPTHFDRVPQAMMVDYLTRDVVYNLEIASYLEQQLKAEGRWDMPYLGHDLPQVQLLTEVEQYGIAVDTEQLALEDTRMQADIAPLVDIIQDLTNSVVTKPGSLVQWREYLYRTEKRPIKHRTKGGAPAMDKAVLEDNSDLLAIQALRMYRRVTDLHSSYIKNMPKFIFRDVFGVPRVHPTFKHWNVVTHRLSAENPPVQTIPHKDEAKDTVPPALLELIQSKYPEAAYDGDYGTRIKRTYVAAPGYALVQVDGAGWEVSCAAAQSQDPFLVETINRGESPHNRLCDMLFGAGWTKAQKVREKNVFFGWIYRGTAAALAHETLIPIKQVKEVVDFLEERLPVLKQWRLDLFEQARKGYIDVPFFNYRIHFDLITDRVLKDLPKQAVNYPNQGLGSMMISRAAIMAHPALKRLGGHIVVLVHDSFMAEVPIGKELEAARIMRDAIVKAGQAVASWLRWDAEAETGLNWGDLKELDVNE